MLQSKPVVLVFAGHDPSGGAGIQADIEAIAAQGCHAAAIVTATTIQNSHAVKAYQTLDPEWVAGQFAEIASDLSISAVKLGMLGDARMAETVAQLLQQIDPVPVVLDPVLAGGGGGRLGGTGLVDALVNVLLPLTTVTTPNSDEARRLTGLASLAECALALLQAGSGHVLITGTHEPEESVINTLYSTDQPTRSWSWERLPHSYHGSGCTLASALAAQLAQGRDMESACRLAQEYAWHTLEHAHTPGSGQPFPDRLYRVEY